MIGNEAVNSGIGTPSPTSAASSSAHSVEANAANLMLTCPSMVSSP